MGNRERQREGQQRGATETATERGKREGHQRGTPERGSIARPKREAIAATRDYNAMEGAAEGKLRGNGERPVTEAIERQ
jgi:hypothetical protein